MNFQDIISKGVICESKDCTEDLDERIPKILADVYRELGQTKELKIGDWVVLSQSESKIYNIELINNNVLSVHNFAYMYRGMGWVYVAAIDLTNGKVFIRNEGGSNGYDSEANFKKTIDFIKNDKIDKYLSLDKFFHIITNNLYDKLQKFIL
jgi:hypothetical protein